MSEQDRAQATTKRRRSRQTSKQNGDLPTSPPQRSAPNDKEAWIAHWEKQGQPWRAEPEINEERQKYLDERRSIVPVIEKGIYPFKDIKLNRADVEWLLATHENGRGPIDWHDANQRERMGLDLRGADLRRVNLCKLPLACLCGALNLEEISVLPDPSDALEESIWMIHLEGANLSGAHLEGANLFQAHLEGADLTCAFLDEAILSGAYLESAFLNLASLKGTLLVNTHLEQAVLTSACLDKTNLIGAYLGKSYLHRAFLGDIDLQDATLSNENGIGPYLVDVHWRDTTLAVVKWSQVKMLGEEYEAGEKQYNGEDKYKGIRLAQYEEAVRANQQLSIVLQTQGLNEHAARFAYRAQELQKKVLWFQMTEDYVKLRQRVRPMGAWIFSWFLFLLAGYGYKPWRSFLAYLIVITTFATTYFIIGRTVGPALSPLGSFVFSMTSFHGRGFFPGGIKLDDPLTVLAALEAFVGLLIEVTFIATLTRRLFGG